MFGGITWICILWSQIRFRQAMAVQGMSRDDLPWKACVKPASERSSVPVG
jgi:amino acid transporter